MLGLHVHAVDIVEAAVPRLGDHRQRPHGPPVVPGRRRPVLRRVANGRVAHDADRVGVRQQHRPVEQARLLDPGQARHLRRCRSARSARRSTGRLAPSPCRGAGSRSRPCGTSVALDQRHVADLDACHVGDGVERPRGSEVERDAQVAGARLRGGTRERPGTRGARSWFACVEATSRDRPHVLEGRRAPRPRGLLSLPRRGRGRAHLHDRGPLRGDGGGPGPRRSRTRGASRACSTSCSPRTRTTATACRSAA